MKKAILIGVVFAAMTVVAVKPAEAIWPFGSLRAEEKQADESPAARWRELRQEMHEWRNQWREARKEALTDFLGLKRGELAQKSAVGETPREIVEEQGLDIAQWRKTRQETRRGTQSDDGETTRLGRGR